MSDRDVIEEPLRFGPEGTLLGILTTTDVRQTDQRKNPVFVFLNAGLLHRVGPFRLHVRLARELAKIGFCSLRVDQAGKGDSLPRVGLTHRQSVEADFDDILAVLESRLGHVPIVLAGLCAGADNAIKLAPRDPRVVGMILLDPYCSPDIGFRARAVGWMFRAWLHKLTIPSGYVRWMQRRTQEIKYPNLNSKNSVNPLALRDLPTLEQMRAAFGSIRVRNGRVFAMFTRYAVRYYNQSGQMGQVLNIEDYEQYCTEVFWPQVEHTYVFELNRRRLMEEIKGWAAEFIR